MTQSKNVYPSASEENFRELASDENALGICLDLVALYLGLAFDDPASGEVESWTLSCLPTTNGGQRLFTLNIGPMEVLYVEIPYLENRDTDVWSVSMYVSRTALEERTGKSFDDWTSDFPNLGFHRSQLVSAEGDAVVIRINLLDDASNEEFVTLVDDAALLRRLADRLVAKGKGPYGHYHNRWFAQAVLDHLREAPDEALM
ncbi:hypothetical protein ACFWDA_14040 [Rhodococcus zopfii]|uniref:Uncharacterized protein n=1 Tax=Rhodococcus zopfii TaxID=43772 RepID=A0ABU3WVM6_9NOCA|nr:hypothetical protein [Rhodococcus zopfii]MDV2477649.1 hypothetical protein [Rhodococcus zopfii]